MSRVSNTFMEIVQIDSPLGQEKPMFDWLWEKLSELGYDLFEDTAGGKIGSNSNNLIAKKNTGADTTVLLNAHMDTVRPGVGIKPNLKDGVISSDGTTILGADCKAGVAAIIEALEHIEEQQLETVNLEVVFTVSEEGGLLGARELDYSLLEADYGYVFAAGGVSGSIFNASPGHIYFDATFKGQMSHAGAFPERGNNAIMMAARALSKIQVGRLDEESTANIGIIQGGDAENVVPDTVEVWGEVRSFDEEKLKKHLLEIQTVFENEAKDSNGDVTFNWSLTYPPFYVDEGEVVLQKARVAAEALGCVPQVMAAGGGSDTCHFNANGIATVNLTTGQQNVHTNEECVAVADLEACVETILQLVTL